MNEPLLTDAECNEIFDKLDFEQDPETPAQQWRVKMVRGIWRAALSQQPTLEPAPDMTNKERIELEHRRGWMSRNPFCPDHRDKVQGLSCRQCEIEHLTRIAALVHPTERSASKPEAAIEDPWIPVTERLPEMDVPVFALDDRRRIVFRVRGWDSDGWYWCNPYNSMFHDGTVWKCSDAEMDDDYQVTHWHALPEPLPTASGNDAEARSGEKREVGKPESL